jgi:hypothetical protein
MRRPGAGNHCLAMALTLLCGVAYGYDGPGHYLATRMAVAALPQEMPPWFRSAGQAIAGDSLDPDIFKLDSLPQLRNGEYPEHYFDMEMLKGQAPPDLRYSFYEFCAKTGLDPDKVGTLPYALAEWTQRLTVAFAEARRWPDDARVQAKCIVYAGILAHYAEDATQPLHTTIDYDGRTLPNGKSPRSGIHAKVDALIEKVAIKPTQAGGIRPEAFEKLWPGILVQLGRSHALVEKTYALEKLLPARGEPLPDNEQVAAFANDRLRAAAELTASLFLTAWRDAARMQLPDWHTRCLEHSTTAKEMEPGKK